MSQPMSAEQIARIKAKMREDPEIQRLARTLGITVERFLEDIEEQGQAVQLHDATTPGERARTERQIVAAAEKGYGEAEDRRQTLQGRRDVRLGADSARREGAAVSLAGGRTDKSAPKAQGTGAVLGDDEAARDRLKKQLGAARLRG